MGVETHLAFILSIHLSLAKCPCATAAATSTATRKSAPTFPFPTGFPPPTRTLRLPAQLAGWVRAQTAVRSSSSKRLTVVGVEADEGVGEEDESRRCCSLSPSLLEGEELVVWGD